MCIRDSSKGFVHAGEHKRGCGGTDHGECGGEGEECVKAKRCNSDSTKKTYAEAIA